MLSLFYMKQISVNYNQINNFSRHTGEHKRKHSSLLSTKSQTPAKVISSQKCLFLTPLHQLWFEEKKGSHLRCFLKGFLWGVFPSPWVSVHPAAPGVSFDPSDLDLVLMHPPVEKKNWFVWWQRECDGEHSYCCSMVNWPSCINLAVCDEPILRIKRGSKDST